MEYPDQPRAGYVVLKTNSMAVRSLIFGLAQFGLWFLVLIPGFVSALIALILGIVALRQIARRGAGGRGLAIAGVVLGAVGVLGGIIAYLAADFGSWVFTSPHAH